jgi:hypothetical protein
VLALSPGSTPPSKPASGPVGCILGGLIGIAVAYLLVEPGSASGLEYMGYFMYPLIGMIIGVAAGLLVKHNEELSHFRNQK